jgi:hypothetical protein
VRLGTGAGIPPERISEAAIRRREDAINREVEERLAARMAEQKDQEMVAKMKSSTGISGSMRAASDGTPTWAKGAIAVLGAIGSLVTAVLITISAQPKQVTSKETDVLIAQISQLKEELKMAPLEQRLKSIEASIESLKTSRSSHDIRQDQNIKLLAGFGSAQNGGKPNENWITAGQFDGPPAGQEFRLPRFTTASQMQGAE